MRRARTTAINAAAALALAATLAAAALASGSLTKNRIDIVAIAAGHTRTLNVPYPDALEYGNARYSGRVVVLAPAAGARGGRPDLAKVRILSAQPALGGSLYRVRARNANAAGTAAPRLEVIATTVEPLPHG